jgi:hypothetical protein
MFTAYFDASGTPADTVLTMAGYVSDAKKWGKFEQRWQRILDDAEVRQFHMTECVSGKGDYKGWAPEKRKQFIADLSDCARKYTNKRFSATVIVGDFNRADAEFQIHEYLGYPYALCGASCIEHVLVWAHNRQVKNKIVYLFEDGDKHTGDLERICEMRFAKYGVEPLFKKKKDFIPFQLDHWTNDNPVVGT